MNIINFLVPKNSVAYLEDTATIKQGLEKMHSQSYTAIPVITKDGIYIGTVTEGDFLWNIVESSDYSTDLQEPKTVMDILRCDWNTPVHITDTIDILLELVTVQNFVPVVDDREVFIGIITRKDIIKYFRKTYMKE